MLEKLVYDSWASRIRLFIKWKKHGRMMLDSIDNGLLVYPTVEENGQTIPKKYFKLTKAQQLQDESAKDIWDKVKLLMKAPELSYQECGCRLMTMQQVQVNTKFLNALPSKWSKFVTDVKLAKSLYTTNYDQLYAYLIQHERHVNEVRIMSERYPDPLALQGEDPIECIHKAMAFLFNEASRFPPLNNQLRTSSNPRNQTTIQDAGQPRVVKCYNYQGERHMARECTQPKRPRNATWFKEKLMLAEAQEVDLDAYDSDCDDLSLAKAVLMANLSSCDSDVLSEESQDAVIQETNSSTPNDLLVISLVEQMTDHVAHLNKENQTNKIVNESLTAELERYKEQSKEKESKYIDKEIVLEKQNKELENIICKMYPSTQAMHMLMKPQVFYDDTHKQALGYQNPFNLKKPQWIQPTLYDGSVIAKEHVVISMINDEETLILEEKSRSEMLDKQNDPISIEKKIKISLIDYSKLNKIKEDFGKHFITKKELFAEQDFWLKHSSFSETPVTSHTPVRIEAPSELPNVSLVNESLKKLKYQLAIFDKVVKNRTTSDAITAGAWGYTVGGDDINNIDSLRKHSSPEMEMEWSDDNCDDGFRENFGENLNAPTFNQFFKINELKAQSQEKDIVIRKLKDKIKSLMDKEGVENVKKDIDEIETINIELEHSVAKLLFENENLRKEREHLKSIFKDQFDSIKKTRVQTKEHTNSLIAQINAKSVENSYLNAQLQEKVFAIAALKNELRKLKRKNVVYYAVSKPIATIAPGMFKLDIKPISHKLKNNRDVHAIYLDKTIDYTNTLCGFVEHARQQNPSKPLFESACMFTKHVQELLVYVSKTCPDLPKPSEKLVVVTPLNKDKKVRFAEPVTSSSIIPKQTDSLKTKDSNKPLLPSTGVNFTTSASGLMPSGNTKKHRITQPSSRNEKNNVEEHPRIVKSSLNKMNSVYEPISNAFVKHFVRNNSDKSCVAKAYGRKEDAVPVHRFLRRYFYLLYGSAGRRVITAAGGRSYKENNMFKRKVATDLEAVMMISRGLGKDMF
ncbi:hypothetical protein Tco_1318026 [Tanacetum coccineum]